MPLRFLCLSIILILISCTATRSRLIQYHLQPNDTLQSLAHHFNLSAREIIRINDLKDEDLSQHTYLLIPSRGANQFEARAFVPLKKKVVANKLGKSQPQPKGVVTTSLSKEVATQLGALVWPVSGGVLGSSFGKRAGSFHEGVDINAASGTPILAAHDGVVAFSGDRLRGYGNMVVLKGRGIVTIYAHNSRNAVERGERVGQGDVIAEVGQTGKATGPHLHFEVRTQDSAGRYRAVDPLKFLKSQESTQKIQTAKASSWWWPW